MLIIRVKSPDKCDYLCVTLSYLPPRLAWWRHQMETFSALLALCAGNSPVTGEYPAQRPVTRSFDVYFDLSLYKRLCKLSGRWWFETPSRSWWRHRNGANKPPEQKGVVFWKMNKSNCNWTAWNVNDIWITSWFVKKTLPINIPIFTFVWSITFIWYQLVRRADFQIMILSLITSYLIINFISQM